MKFPPKAPPARVAALRAAIKKLKEKGLTARQALEAALRQGKKR